MCAYRVMTGVKRLDKVHNTTVLTAHQSPATRSYTQSMIDNCDFLVTCSETHVLHMPVAMRYTIPANSWHNKTWPSSTKLVDYIERLTGMRTDELVEVSQDREAWRELVVACVDPRPTTRERERERESIPTFILLP